MAVAGTVPVKGANVPFTRAIREALGRYPDWFLRAARVKEVVVTDRPDVREQVAMMEHGSRILYVSPGVGGLLVKAVGHECWHGADDDPMGDGNPHYFSSSDAWRKIHRFQPHFDISKYRDEPLEFLADMGAKLFLLGPAKLEATNRLEVEYLTRVAIPTLYAVYGGKT